MGWAIGCLLWVQNKIYFIHLSLPTVQCHHNMVDSLQNIIIDIRARHGVSFPSSKSVFKLDLSHSIAVFNIVLYLTALCCKQQMIIWYLMILSTNVYHCICMLLAHNISKLQGHLLHSTSLQNLLNSTFCCTKNNFKLLWISDFMWCWRCWPI